MIQYYFPYKNLIEEDWKGVLTEFIPKVIDAKNETEYTLTMLELIARIHDTHANVWGNNQALNNYYGQKYPAFGITFIEGKAIVTDFYDEEKAKKTGLKIGDILLKIDGKEVDEIIKESLKRTPASNYPTQLRDIAQKCLRTNNTSIDIEFTSENKTTPQKASLEVYAQKDINIYKKYEQTDSCFQLIDKDIAYLNNGSLKSNYLPTIWPNIKGTKGLIIDIRNYPSDFPIYKLSAYLMPSGTSFVKFTNGSIETPGLFTFGAPLKAGIKNKNAYQGKVVILVNETSQSSAEFHTMAYQVHPNATVIGSTTAAADGNVSRIRLPGGILTMISGIGVYYPDGRETQRVGIVPNIEVKPTVDGIRTGRDEVMEKAIELINNG